jgi:uncharacterized membrane protein
MSTTVYGGRVGLRFDSGAMLTAAAWFWGAVVMAGQVVFSVAVAALYGGSALRGNWEGWNRVQPEYVPGHGVANAAFGAHVLVASLLMLAGGMQLVPGLRRRVPRLHRWTGRVYITAAFFGALSALYMIWVRGAVGDLFQHISSTIEAGLMMICAAQALRFAIARRIAVHRRWALRLFMVVSGVWTFRVFMMLWLLAFKGPVGFDPVTFTGPAINFLGYASYLGPLAVLELYFWAQRGGTGARPRAQISMAVGLAAVTLVMGGGIAAAAVTQWVPQIVVAVDSRTGMADMVSRRIAADGVAAAVAEYRRILAGDMTGYRLSETEMNSLGYQYIHTRRFAAAVAVLRLNAEAFPTSGNCFDSLGEALMDDGEIPAAIAAYRESLRLDPANGNAVRMLARMGAR